MNLTSEILTEAARLVEQGWCQGVAARDHTGAPVSWDAREAAFFCARGAIHRVAGGNVADVALAERALRRVIRLCIVTWNDYQVRNGEEVAATLRAAARADREALVCA